MRSTESGPSGTASLGARQCGMFMNRFALIIGFAAAAFAQPGARRIVSPEVLPDHRITFRIGAPKAAEAVLTFSEGSPQSHPMTKGADGVWSVTIGPVAPEIYTYSFLIDGAKTIDRSEEHTSELQSLRHLV